MSRRLPGIDGLALLLALPLPLAAEVRVVEGPQEPWLRVLVLEAARVSVRPSAEAQGMRVLDERGLPLGLEPAGRTLDLDGAQQQRELWLEAVPGSSGTDPGLWLGSRRFRGRLQLRPVSGQLQVVNHVPLESYLPSVVGSEMPASWPEAALKAQAVAARTYALKARKPAAPYDVKATVASQVYKGVEAETPSTWGAVKSTRGMVLTFGNALIDAVFHSSSGGTTESSGDLWPRQLPYLVSVPDFDQASPVHLWRKPLDGALLQQAFPELDRVLAITVLSTTPSGRVRQARVVGPGSELVLTGAQLRTRLGLRSTWVSFELEPLPLAAAGLVPPPPLPAFSLPPAQVLTSEVVQLVAVGRGYGHGIGMSQWGALAMAQKGNSYEEILRHYYRGAQLQPYASLAQTPAPRPGSGADALQALAPSP
jgi:stage II sporulation protein D